MSPKNGINENSRILKSQITEATVVEDQRPIITAIILAGAMANPKNNNNIPKDIIDRATDMAQKIMNKFQ
jgi:hypothetical protein